jgi:outer membrane protein TolC
MKKISIFKLFLVLFLLAAAQSFAQESIMNDISYPFLQKLIETAKTNYPVVKAKQEQVEIARIAHSQAKFSWFDNLSVSYVYNPENNINQVDPVLFAGYQAAINLNIGTLIKTPFTISSTKHAYTVAVLEQQTYNLNIETQVKRLYLAYIQAIAVLRIRTKTAQDVGSLLDQSKRQFEKGNETIENYTHATTAFSDINQTKIDAEVAVLNAKGALEEIVGKKLEEVK